MSLRLPSRLLPTLLLLALAAPGARATDAKAVDTPTKLRDGVVQIGERAVRLPPGDWTLVHVKDFHPARMRDIDVTTAWVVLLRDGGFGMAMQLSLQASDMKKERRIPDNPCTARDGVLRGDYSYARTEMECLAVFGHHDMTQLLEQRGPRTVKWLAKQGVGRVADGVEVTYSHREGAMIGRVAFYFPAQAFASDDDAAQWAAAVRSSFEPLIERRVAAVSLPALPAPLPTDPPARP